MENYGTMKKIMVQYQKKWYYTKNCGTLLYYEKNMKCGTIVNNSKL